MPNDPDYSCYSCCRFSRQSYAVLPLRLGASCIRLRFLFISLVGWEAKAAPAEPEGKGCALPRHAHGAQAAPGASAQPQPLPFHPRNIETSSNVIFFLNHFYFLLQKLPVLM